MLNLSKFQRQTLEQLILKRKTAQQEEAEFVDMVFKAAGVEKPEVPIELKDGSLIWEENKAE